jgi:hypothetical protein
MGHAPFFSSACHLGVDARFGRELSPSFCEPPVKTPARPHRRRGFSWAAQARFAICLLATSTCVRCQFHSTQPPAAGEPALQQALIPYTYQRQIVQFHWKEAPGSIVVDTDARFLYYVLPEEKAIRYGVIVDEDARVWSGVAKVGRKQEWPRWTPTEGEKPEAWPAY